MLLSQGDFALCLRCVHNMLLPQGDGALLYKRQKARCALSQAELVFQILREGVQSAHSQVNAMMWAGGDSLKEMIENCSGEHEPFQKLLRAQQVLSMCVILPCMYVCIVFIL